MFKIPSDNFIDKCIITKEVIESNCEPDIIRLNEKEIKKIGAKKRFGA